jgi:hypothetical protein
VVVGLHSDDWSFDRPLILMALVLASGALLWLKIDPEQELVLEDGRESAKLVLSTRLKRNSGADGKLHNRKSSS